MTPGAICAGAHFHAVIGREILEDASGRNLRFASSLEATKFAIAEKRRRSAPLEAEKAPEPAPEPSAVRSWREERARQRMEDHIRGTLLGVEVVTKKRRRVTA